MKEAMIELGESGINLGKALQLILQGKIDFSETLYQIYRAGVQSVPVVVMSATFIGLAMSLQIARELVVTYGASRFVGGMVTVAIVREIGPVFTAVAVVGNVGSSIAAEIASMEVSEQVDALKVFNISPISYLVIPRLLATSVVTPMLGILGSAIAVLVGMLISQFLVDISYGLYLDSAQSALTIRDMSISVTKSFCFGVAIAIIACSFGLRTRGGAEEVGTTTTRAVIWGLLAIFIINFLITAFFYDIGIRT